METVASPEEAAAVICTSQHVHDCIYVTVAVRMKDGVHPMLSDSEKLRLAVKRAVSELWTVR